MRTLTEVVERLSADLKVAKKRVASLETAMGALKELAAEESAVGVQEELELPPPRADRRAAAAAEDAADVAAVKEALKDPRRVPWSKVKKQLGKKGGKRGKAESKKARRAPPPSPAGPVKMPMHLCHKCSTRTDLDPCPRCGAKVPVMANLASMAPDLRQTDGESE